MIYTFGTLELDLDTRELRAEDRVIPLGPKPFDLLALLVAKQGAVVTKDELYEQLWPDTYVSEWALTSAVKLARRGLREAGLSPSDGVALKTVHGRGFRFVGDVREGGAGAETVVPPVISPAATEAGLVGRGGELEELRRVLDAAARGEPQTAVVVGEAGIGKTALVDAFLEGARTGGARVAVGQAVEHYGRGQPYLPVLEAWGRLLHGVHRDEFRPALEDLAPSWLAHLPGESEGGIGAPALSAIGRSSDRMLREMGALVEATTKEHPLVVVLEDLHWSDHATIELLVYLMQRRAPARVLWLLSYRPSELPVEGGALRGVVSGLGGRGRGVELKLGALGRDDVGAYLRQRFGGASVDDEVAQSLYARTEGHPLFLSNLVDVGLREGTIRATDASVTLAGDLHALVPSDLHKMLDARIASLPEEECTLLENASAAGVEFSAALLAASLERPLEVVEEACERLAWRELFLEDADVEQWPDGTVAGRFRFVHSLYREVLYARLASARRVRAHRAMAERKEQAFGGSTADVSAELAEHFERARDPARAIRYRREAAGVAAARHAHREAGFHLEKALGSAVQLPGDERGPMELELLLERVGRLRSARSFGDGDPEAFLERALPLARDFGSDQQRVRLLTALSSVRLTGGDTSQATAFAEEALARSQGLDAVDQMEAHLAVGAVLSPLEDYRGSEEHFRAALELYDEDAAAQHRVRYGDADPGVRSEMWLASVLQTQGHIDAARDAHDAGLARAEGLGHPLSQSWAWLMSALFLLSRSEREAAEEALDRSNAIAQAEGFDAELTMVDLAQGWTSLLRGDLPGAVAALEGAVARYREVGALLPEPVGMMLLGVAHGFAGRAEESSTLFDEARERARATGQPGVERLARRNRVMVQSVMGVADPTEAETELLALLEGDRAAGDRTGELATANLLAALRLREGDPEGARAVLEPVSRSFREGRSLPSLVEAEGLLGQVEREPASDTR